MRSGLKILEEFILALIREFLGADSVSVGLSYDVNLKWHMPICAEICGAEPKYMPFFGTTTERDLRKKNPKHRNIYKWHNAALWIFSAKRAR